MQSFLIVAFPICSWKCFDVTKFLGYSHYNLCRDMLGWSNGARSHNLHNKLCKNPFTLQCRDTHDSVFGHPSFCWGIFILKGTSQSWPFKFACGINQIIDQKNEGHPSCFGVGGRTCQMTSVTEILQYGASWVYLRFIC